MSFIDSSIFMVESMFICNLSDWRGAMTLIPYFLRRFRSTRVFPIRQALSRSRSHRQTPSSTNFWQVLFRTHNSYSIYSNYTQPPIWIKMSTTICPNKLQVVIVGNVTRPVTQVAVVAVNNASMYDTDSPSPLIPLSTQKLIRLLFIQTVEDLFPYRFILCCHPIPVI